MSNLLELVSVIMPCHNGEKFLCKAIGSVIDQTYTNWELIIIDDKSTDDSANIAKEFALSDKRIKCLSTKLATGSPAMPRNLGIMASCGRYIAFLDSDDIWLPNKLEKQISLFQNKNAAIVFSDYEKIDNKGNRSCRKITGPNIIDYKKELCGNSIGNLTGIFDKTKCGLPLFKNVGHEDYLFWLLLLKKGFIAYNVGEILALYRQSSNSLSSDKRYAAKWTWNIYHDELHLSIIKCCYYFSLYALKGVIKSLK